MVVVAPTMSTDFSMETIPIGINHSHYKCNVSIGILAGALFSNSDYFDFNYSTGC